MRWAVSVRGGNDTDLPMIDFLRRRSDGSVRPSMETVATGSSFAFGDAGWARGHSIDAESEGPWLGSQRDKVVMFASGRVVSGEWRVAR